jgi:hypothetical protein
MMDAIVQFIRNALCCVKDLQLFGSTFIHDASYTNQTLSSLTAPLDKTTPLEVIISITQLYACLSNTKSGVVLLSSSIGKLRRILRLVEKRMGNIDNNKWTDADLIINESLMKEGGSALRSTFVGALVAPIGICFWWLFINSWHVTEVDWFGGLPALIHALEVMEICLIPLLYYMIVDGLTTLRKSKTAKALVQEIRDQKLVASAVKNETYRSMTGWSPFWGSGVSVFTGVDKLEEEERFASEIENVKEQLRIWFPSSVDKRKGEKEAKQSKEAFNEAEERIFSSIDTFRMEGYREFVYFLLNFAAFYGCKLLLREIIRRFEILDHSHLVCWHHLN